MSPTTAGEKVTVYVPCDTATVRVRLGYQDTVTPIEQIVLRAVDAGASTLHELCHVLGLGRRLTLDAVQDLWRTGYLRLVNSYAGLAVSQEVTDHIKAGTLDRMRSAETLIDVREVMIDKLSGYIMPVYGSSAPALRKFAVPVENSMVRIGDAPMPALLDAIERGLANEDRDRRADPGERSRGTRQRRVFGAFLNGDQFGAAHRRWIPLEIQTATDPDTDQLVVSVVDGRLPEAYRAEAARQLNRLAATRPTDEFVQALRGSAAPGLISAPTVTRAATRLREQAVTAANIPAGQRGNWHRELSQQYRQLVGLSEDRARHEVTARVVVGAAHTAALQQMIEDAETQLVLVGPWVRYEALNVIAPSLRVALKKNVQVVLLWGIGYEDKIDPQAAGLLYDLALRSGARVLEPAPLEPGDAPAESAVRAAAAGAPEPWFLLPDSAARTHAKLVVADDRAALVTSWNLLSRSAPKDEVGVVVQAPDGAPGHGSEPVQEILRWARTVVPGYEMSRLMLVSEQDFTLRLRTDGDPDIAEAPSCGWSMPQFPDAPESPSEGTDDHSGQAARHWSDAWQHLADYTDRELASRSHPPAHVVIDGAHRTLLWEALRNAQHRLVVTSDRLSRQVVDESMLDVLDKAATRGVTVDIVYGRPHERESAAGSGAPTEAERALTALAARYPDTFRVVRRSGAHAKVLVWDDEAIVSSFNFLSFEGSYGAMAAHLQRSELGLRLSGRAFADDAARATGVVVAERHQVTDPPQPAPALDPSFTVAQHVLNAIASGTDAADAVADHLSTVGDPWRALDRLAEHAGRPLLRLASAYCLSTHTASAAALGRRERWLRWLIEDLWTDGHYSAAALLRSTADGDLRPGLEVTRLAAARGGPFHSEILTDTWERLAADDSAGTDRQQMERTTVLVAALERMLFHGDQDAETIVRLELSDPGDDALRSEAIRLAEAVVAYAEAGSGRPVPLRRIHSDLDRRSDLAKQARLWSRLDEGFERTAHTHLTNTHSLRTLQHLFQRTGGAFTRLHDAVKARVVTEIADWLDTALPPRNQLGRLIDEASHEVNPDKEPMRGDHRKKLMRHLTTIVTDARALVGAYQTVGDLETATDSDEAKLEAAAFALAAAVAAELPDLITLIEAAAAPEARFVREMLESFVILQEWASVRSTGTAVTPS